MHLTEHNIQELAYAYVKKVKLSDKQVTYKRHMADCDDCFNKFLVERELQEALMDTGLISSEAMESVLKGTGQTEEKVLLRMKKAADGLRLFIEEMKERADSLWNFYPAPQMAFSRGSEKSGETAEIYENPISEYSMIRVSRDGLLIRLDEEDYGGNHLILQVIKGDKTERIPFVYNDEEESYDAFVAGEIEEGTQFEIVGAADED